MTLTGCHKDELRELHKNIEEYRDLVIPSMEAQVESVDASVKDVQAMNEELKGYVVTLEALLVSFQPIMDNIKQDLADFTAKSQTDLSESREKYLAIIDEMESSLTEQLDKAAAIAEALGQQQEGMGSKIDEFQAYIEAAFAKHDWVEATFATLAVQNALYYEVESIKYDIESLTNTVNNLYDKMSKLVDQLISEYATNFDGELRSAMEKLTSEYTEAVKKMKEDLTSDYQKKLSDAIAASEEGIKTWFGELSEGYLTITEANVKIARFYELVGNIPEGESLQGELDKIKDNLSKLKSSLDKGFEDYLTQAIKEFEGAFTTEMTEAFKTLNDNVTFLSQNLTALGSRIQELTQRMVIAEKDMDDLQADLKTLDKDITDIETSLKAFFGDDYATSKLATIITGLKEQIEKLLKDIATNAASIETIKKDAETIQKSYEDLEHIQPDLEQLEKDITALQNFFDTGTSLDAIVQDLKTDILNCASQTDLDALSEIVSKLKTQISILETAFAEALTTLDGIKTFFGITDETSDTLQKLLNDLYEQLESINSDLVIDAQTLTTYTARVQAVEDRIKAVEEVSEIASSLSSLLGRMTTIENDLTALKPLFDFTGSELSGTFAEIWTALTNALNELQTWEVFNKDSEDRTLRDQIHAIEVILYGEGGSASNPKEGSLLYKINTFETQVVAYNLANSFAGITYIPTRLDQAAEIDKDSKAVSFQFIVSPSSFAKKIAEYINAEDTKQYFGMKWFSGSTTGNDFVSYSASFSDQILTVSVTGNDDLVTAANSTAGAFAAFFVDMPLTDLITLSFTSDFIQMKVQK